MVIHGISVEDSLHSSSYSNQHTFVKQLRRELVERYRPIIQQGPGPTRVMARMVAELESICREHHIDDEVIQAEIVNRTIGDVNLRLVTECEGEPGGPGDYRMLADELGVALPGEQLHGYTATGETYLWLREQMQVYESELLAQRYDPRIYDIYGIGNPLLRSWLAEEMRQWGLPAQKEQVFLGMGSMDCINKVLQGFCMYFKDKSSEAPGILFPEPGFNVPEWQARSYGYNLHRFHTCPEDNFKLRGSQLEEILEQAPDIRLIYLTVTNNPTTFAYTADELNELFVVLRKHWERGRDIFLIADLAYIGTASRHEDQPRMAAFAMPDVLAHTIFLSSFSKSFSLTGERLGWVTIGDAELAPSLNPGWTNSSASLPGEWQLRFMAYYRLIQSRPWLLEKLQSLYRLRRKRLIAQLEHLNRDQRVFRQIHLGDDATVYNWSQLEQGEDAFSLFEKTGIAGVPGSGFGYSDDYIRFSIGVIPVPVMRD
ncbi:MAG TPA: pyridoxal phosphate-dependent aminotransferase [Ktedonobacteraceae bacterium]|nr:pyridoxal phosphate-dependent aminotransferase [Ktedonobacteraceae bacterium]